MSVQTNTALIERAYAAWNAGAQQYADWISEAVATTVKMHVPQGDLTGLDMLRAYYYEIRGAFADGCVKVDEIAAEGDTVIVRYTFSGTNTGKLLTLPLITGKPASLVIIDVFHLMDGKVVEFWESYDRFGMLEQLGSMREPAPTFA
ncbi:MAG TPA: ester cyclase [Chloroflexota bacterium]|jgi:predicted ester cyclase